MKRGIMKRGKPAQPRRETHESMEAWRLATLGPYPSTAKMASRANREMVELLDAIADGLPAEKIAEEAADVAIVLYGVAGSVGLDLAAAIDRKMAVNRQRKWKVVDGIGHHVHEDPPPQPEPYHPYIQPEFSDRPPVCATCGKPATDPVHNPAPEKAEAMPSRATLREQIQSDPDMPAEAGAGGGKTLPPLPPLDVQVSLIEDRAPESKPQIDERFSKKLEADRPDPEQPTSAAYQILREVAAERLRQIVEEGWTPQHDDDEHGYDDLARAAACYALPAYLRDVVMRGCYGSKKLWRWLWPFTEDWWKPKDQRRDLIRAAALLIAQIEQVDRRANREAADG